VEQKLLDSKTIFKLRVLEELSKREVVDLDELSGELGVQATEISAIIDEMRKNHLIRVEDSSVIWLAGDNPSRIKPWGWSYIYKTIVGSTMHVAKRLPSWSIVVAEYQVHGYGRHGKEWISDLGGVWITFKFPLEEQIAQYLPIAIPVILCELFKEKFSVDAKIKWPNDIVVNRGKLAGIIIEGEYYKNRLHVYAGIGINVNNDPKLEKAVSLKNITGKLVPRNRIISYLSGVMGRIEKYIENYKKLQAQYLELLETLGRRVAVLVLGDGAITGKVIGVTETGDLVVDTGVEKVKLSSTEVYELKYL
jgi:BirA family biotin operon repressor/biotin-[acetyl-CoA-carboxylase] ligase